MAEMRQGSLSENIGVYVGSTYDQSEALSQTDMDWNAMYISDVLSNKFGWTVNAISAILGNMHAESSINPGRWQSDEVGNMNGGYSLVQWTPATKVIDWIESEYGGEYTDGVRITQWATRPKWITRYSALTMK